MTKAELDSYVQSLAIPLSMRIELDNYLKQLKAPGEFLRSILENDLYSTLALSYHDEVKRKAAPAIVRYIHSTFPPDAYGSRERVRNWLDSGIDSLLIN